MAGILLIVVPLASFLFGTVSSVRLQVPFTGITPNIRNTAEVPVAETSRPQGLPDFVSLAKPCGSQRLCHSVWAGT